MSPSEHDLRRALHHGEQDAGVDPGRIVALGEARRAQRRVRVRGGVAAGALVAVVTTGGVLLARSGGDDQAGSNSAGGAAVSRPSAAASSEGAGSQRSASIAAGPAAGTAGCPSSYPRTLLPGGGSSGQFGSNGRLVARPVTAVTVCGYGSTGANTGRVALGQALARRLVASLEAAQTGRTPCPTSATTTRATAPRLYALIPIAADGSALRTVTVELDRTGCPNMVSNGTAFRTLWRPPSGLDGIFARLGTTTSPGRLNGSPVRS